MSNHSPDISPAFLSAAVFRLLDTCVVWQRELADYYRTAALEPVPGIEDLFRWLRKRGVKVVLVSELSRAATVTVLDRLQWTSPLSLTTPKLPFVDQVVFADTATPLALAAKLKAMGNITPRETVTVGDTLPFLDMARGIRPLFSFAATYGSTTYRKLLTYPHDGLVESPRELPNLLLERILAFGPPAGDSKTAPRLRIRLPLFRQRNP